MLHVDCIAVHVYEVRKGGQTYSVPCWGCYWAVQMAEFDDNRNEFWIPDTERDRELLQQEWEEWQRVEL